MSQASKGVCAVAPRSTYPARTQLIYGIGMLGIQDLLLHGGATVTEEKLL